MNSLSSVSFVYLHQLGIQFLQGPLFFIVALHLGSLHQLIEGGCRLTVRPSVLLSTVICKS